MRSTAIWTTVVASSFGLALAAQTSVGTVMPSHAGVQDAPAATATTMTGCLQRIDAGGHYKLTNTTTVASGGAMLDAARFTPSLSGTDATAAKKAAAGPRLESSDLTLVTHVPAVRFDKHVGQQVEVIGTLERAAAMGTGGTMGTPATTATTGTIGADASPQGTTGAPTLNVNVLRIISKSCK